MENEKLSGEDAWAALLRGLQQCAWDDPVKFTLTMGGVFAALGDQGAMSRELAEQINKQFSSLARWKF